MMLTLGLTGSIGMGKTETAKMFRSLGIPVFDSDAAVHRLYAAGGAAVATVGEAFPGVVRDGAIDREHLSRIVLSDPKAIARLEAIVHPLVQQAQRDFAAASEASGADILVLDIPLLFETGGQDRVDKVIVVSAPAEVQRARVLERPGMSEEKFEAILAKQVPDAEKRARADFIIETDNGLHDAMQQVGALVDGLRASMAAHGEPG
jgi:dephospho-CoA kinase